MPRPKRYCLPGVPQHVVQRGNNRQATFFHEEDYFAYLQFLDAALVATSTQLHAYVLMTNHVHLLVTPSTETGLSLLMQSLGRSYVNYINATYQRTGTLWEGRFKASLIDTERYCLACYRYIELNPVRAKMVEEPADHCWSSYHRNAMGESNSLVDPHPAYRRLGTTELSRQQRYRQLLEEVLDTETIEAIRYGARKGLPVGSSKFNAQVEQALGCRLGNGRRGRPRKRRPSNKS